MALNNVILNGRLVREPEVQHTNGNVSLLKFTVAVDRDYVNPAGQRDTDFINCTAWRQSAEYLGKYAHKGDLIAVAGRLAVNKWTDREGNNRNDIFVEVKDTYILRSKNDRAATAEPAKLEFPTKPAFTELDDDDDLPFDMSGSPFDDDALPL